MGRGAFAFRDLDEELHSFVDDDSVVHIYQSHSSPPSLRTDTKTKQHKPPGPKPAARATAKTTTSRELSDSMVLKRYVDHHRAQRRRKLLGSALFVGVALLGAVPLLLSLESAHTGEPQSALELALAAPYKALRVRRTETDRDNINEGEGEQDDVATGWELLEPSVGDYDPHDDHGVADKMPRAKREEIKEVEDSDSITSDGAAKEEGTKQQNGGEDDRLDRDEEEAVVSTGGKTF